MTEEKKGKKIRVLVVDDSALIRESLKAILNSDPSFEIVGEAVDGQEGYKKTLALKPDVITMDLNMPQMMGLEIIQKIMEEMPTPIIVVSSMDVKIIVKALTIGAMDFVAITGDINEIANSLIEKVKIASRVKPIRRIQSSLPSKKQIKPDQKDKDLRVVVIGVSTGGPQALNDLFMRLPKNLPACILVVQHISDGFIEGLTEWLKDNSKLNIRTAQTGDVLKNGEILFAPDHFNMRVYDNGTIGLKEDLTKKMIHVPSIDELMISASQVYGKNIIGIIMTGMGRDGVEGIRAIKKAKGITIAQDEETSSIFGMNKIAIEQGLIDMVRPLDMIADEIVNLLQ